MNPERQIPHDEAAEKGVLGCCILSPRDCISELQARATTDVFHDERNRLLASVLCEMFDANDPIDTSTVYQKLAARQLIPQIGGLNYLTDLPNNTPSAANLEYYLSRICEQWERRKLLQVTHDIQKRIYSDAKTDHVLEQAEREVLSVRNGAASVVIKPMRQLVHAAIDRLEAYSQKRGMLGLTTGLIDLDDMTGGLQNGDMVIIAGRPSTGKTSLALNIAEHVACTHGPTAVFSLEMSDESLIVRALCTKARVNVRNIQAGNFGPSEFPKVTTAAATLAKAPLYIDPTPSLSVEALRARARRMKQRYGIQLVVVDYLQLMHSTAHWEGRQQEITRISGGLKAAAKELNVPFVVLSQLNREMEKGERKPRLADLRESGAIEQDADIVGLLYLDKDRMDDKNRHWEKDVLPVNLLIAKQRNGPTGDVRLVFNQGITKFDNAYNA